jgi:prepilin-type N-terminal cleavage/methylation domain-containing protein
VIQTTTHTSPAWLSETKSFARSIGRQPIDSRRGFTLLELLIVVVVIGVLAGAIIATSTVFLNNARIKNTRAVLLIVDEAIEQFRNDQTAKPTIARIRQGNAGYETRYGIYPPDELEVFSPYGLPGAAPATAKYSLAGAANVRPEATSSVAYRPMKFHPMPVANAEHNAREHRDLAALMLSVQLFSESAEQILNRLPERNRSPGLLDAGGRPIQFLDRAPLGAVFGGEDEQIRLVLDDWGVPLSYLSQKDWVAPPKPPAAESSNHAGWNRASTQIIQLNGGRPLIFSYGPDGKDQLTSDQMGDDGAASLVGDWTSSDNPGRVDHPLNADNVYPDSAFQEKLTKGWTP